MGKTKKTCIVIHHSAGSSRARATDIKKTVRERLGTWAYAKIIERSGAVYDDAPEDEANVAHAVGFNRKGIGVCLIGFFDPPEVIQKTAPYMGDYPGDVLHENHPQWRSLVQVCAVLCRRHGIKPQNIIGHVDTFVLRGVSVQKSCPGQRIHEMLPLLREAVARYV